MILTGLTTVLHRVELNTETEAKLEEPARRSGPIPSQLKHCADESESKIECIDFFLKE